MEKVEIELELEDETVKQLDALSLKTGKSREELVTIFLKSIVDDLESAEEAKSKQKE